MTERPIPAKEAAAIARWRPGQRWYHPAMARVTISLSRFITSRMNALEVTNREALNASSDRGGRGLLTISNHVSLFDDPLLMANFVDGPYSGIRWVGADAINFFGSAPKSWLFTAGKSVPIVRGAVGTNQPGMLFLRDRLAEGEWVHMFPEGGRTRDPESRMHQFHPGVGWLVTETHPIVVPFYHHGMQGVLPVGALRPRGGNVIRIQFGEPIDCDKQWIMSALPGGSASGIKGWANVAAALEQAVRAIEGDLNPAVGDRA